MPGALVHGAVLGAVGAVLRSRAALATLALGLLTLSAAPRATAELAAAAEPLAPAAAQQAFVLAEPKLLIELVASEPDVVDPVAVRFDEFGRLWVAELRDYPLGPPGGGPPLSRIRTLTDDDGDGRYENARLFAEQLPFVTGLQPWRGGVIVTLAGRVVYLRDTDGDGRADQDETWFTGFAEQNSQLRANHPRLGLDGWVYVANGLRGGQAVCPKHPERPPVSLSGMDFRFRPDDLRCEAIAGNGQFGLSFDDWGNRFLCTNRNPAIQVIFENPVLKAAAEVPLASPVHDVCAAGEKSRIFPLSRAWTTSNLHAGQFTAACGVHYYQGELLREVLGPANIFTCDPTGNLVHREVLTADGPTFAGKPADEGRDFLTSPDEWFRPVALELGPDDALYVVDMYRAVIEHPDFVPSELKNRPDQRLGDDRGRIWRIRPQGKRVPPPPIAKVGGPEPTPAALVAGLDMGSGWRRETAARLLQERHDAHAAPLLRRLVLNDEARDAAQARALGLLAYWGQLTPELARGAAESNSSGLRAVAGRLLASDPALAAKCQATLRALANRDDAPAARFQALVALAQLPRAELEPIGDKALWLAASHPLSRKAFLLAERHRLEQLTRAALARLSADPALLETAAPLLTEVAELAGGQGQEGVARAVAQEIAAQLEADDGRAAEAARLAALAAFARSYSRKQGGAGLAAPALGLAAVAPRMLAVASRLAAEREADEAARLAALGVLAYLPSALKAVLPLLDDPALPIRLAAVTALARQSGGEAEAAWRDLLARLESFPPAVQRALVDAALAQPARAGLLLDRIEAGELKATQLETLQRNRLLGAGNPQLKARAQKLFADLTPADRTQALADYQPVLARTGDAARGRNVFEKNCASCHKVGGVGVNVAPDISDTRTKTAAQLLGDILQPNRALDSNYLNYVALLKDGQSVAGILAAETPAAVTFRQPGDKTVIVARSELEELRSSGVSLMPEGLEKNIPQPDMADLLAYLKNWRYLDGKTPTAGAVLDQAKP